MRIDRYDTDISTLDDLISLLVERYIVLFCNTREERKRVLLTLTRYAGVAHPRIFPTDYENYERHTCNDEQADDMDFPCVRLHQRREGDSPEYYTVSCCTGRSENWSRITYDEVYFLFEQDTQINIRTEDELCQFLFS